MKRFPALFLAFFAAFASASAKTVDCGEGFVAADSKKLDGIPAVECKRLYCRDLENGRVMGKDDGTPNNGYELKNAAGKWIEDTPAEKYVSGQTIQLPNSLKNYDFNTNTETFTGWSGGIVPGTSKAVGNHEQAIVYRAQYAKPAISKFEVLWKGTRQPFPVGKLIDLGAETMIFKVTYNNGISDEIPNYSQLIKNGTITYAPKSFDVIGNGTGNITITYNPPGGTPVKCVLQVLLAPRLVTSIKVTANPTKVRYYVGESLDLRGGTLELRYNNGTVSYLPLTDKAVSATLLDSKEPGTKTVTVWYDARWNCPLTVSVVNKPAPRLKGDVNGDGKINSMDLLMVKRHILGVEKLKGAPYDAADIDGDGKVNSVDAMRILRHILGTEKIKQPS